MNRFTHIAKSYGKITSGRNKEVYFHSNPLYGLVEESYLDLAGSDFIRFDIEVVGLYAACE